GVWGLPFHFVIALTGAFLGIVTVMLPILAFLAFGGDIDRVTEVLNVGAGERAGIEAPMRSLDEMMQQRHPETGQAVQRILVNHWGDQNAAYTLGFYVDGELLLTHQRVVSGVTGEPLPISPLNAEYALASRVLGMMSALHYGRFGGVVTKLMYVGLGIVLTAVVAFGLVVWIERRSGSSLGQQRPSFYLRLRRMISGFCIGLLWAYSAIFYLDLVYAGTETERLFWTGSVYFLALLAALVLALALRSVRSGLLLLMWGSALAFMLLPLVHGWVTGDGFWRLTQLANPVAAWVDLGLLILGIALGWVAWLLRHPRPAVQPILSDGSQVPMFDSRP
ncbi:MAG: PepSY-associated TM helix domain-containing protein, partial [Pseudomonadota bacterium]